MKTMEAFSEQLNFEVRLAYGLMGDLLTISIQHIVTSTPLALTWGHMMNDSIVHSVVLTERDIIFAHALRHSPGKKVMGIFGCGHLLAIPYLMEHRPPNEPLLDKLHLTSTSGITEAQALMKQIAGHLQRESKLHGI